MVWREQETVKQWRILAGGIVIAAPFFVAVAVWALLGLIAPLTMSRDTALAVYSAEIQLLILLGVLTPSVTVFGSYLRPRQQGIQTAARFSFLFVLLSGGGVTLCVYEMIWERLTTYGVLLPLNFALVELAGFLEYVLAFTGVLDPILVWMLKD
jgi:hypothetical protein